MKFTIHQESRQGPREYNQDRLAYSYSKEALLLVLADGMGGHSHGEIAAELAVKTLTDAFQSLAKPLLAYPDKFLKEYIQQIHSTIDSFALANDLSESPCTTIVAALIQGGKLYCAHAGDSRLYHLRNGRILSRTIDHSVVQLMLQRNQINREEMLYHPERHVIYNCLGGEKPPSIELAPQREMQVGDILLLCSDGLWGGLEDQTICDLLYELPLKFAITQLLDLAESSLGKAGDNLSAIGIQWGDASYDKMAISTSTMALGATTTIINQVKASVSNREVANVTQLSDEDIEKAIADIQAALKRTQR